MQRVQKTFKRIYFRGRLLGEYTEHERDDFSKKMHEYMLRIGRTPEESLLFVATVIALVEANM